MTNPDGMLKDSSKVEARSLEAPVEAVVLFEDRAQVTRSGRAELPAGQVSLEIRDIAPVVAERTLQAALRKAPNGSLVSDVHVVRDFKPVVDPHDTEGNDIESRLREAISERESIEYRQSLARHQLTLVEQMTQKTLDDLGTDVAWGMDKPDEWRKGLHDLTDRESALRKELLDLDEQLQDAAEKQSDLENQSRAANRPDNRVAATIVVELVLPTSGELEVEVSYVVPAACWRPLHTARLSPGEASDQAINFRTEGCVWQNCGEDWRDVRLQFSTQRPSLGFEPPLLGEDVLVTREKPEMVRVEARDEVISTTGLGGRTEAADELPGIDDGGAPLTIDAERTATIPSDGMPYRVQIAEFSCAATTELVTVPELNSSAVTKVTLTNEGSSPILAGPVELVRNHGLVGRTPVLFVASGERFELGFGPDPAIRVRRKVAEVEPDQPPLSRFVVMEHSITLLICNIGDETKQLQITERIPVSEVEQVVVEFDASESTAGATPDENGFVKWEIDLPPAGRETIRLRYTVKKRKNVEL